MLFIIYFYELDHFLCRQKRSCYFLSDYINDWILVDIKVVFLFVVPGTPVCIQFTFHWDHQAKELFLKRDRKHLCDRNMAEYHAYSIKDPIIINVSVCHHDNCVPKPPAIVDDWQKPGELMCLICPWEHRLCQVCSLDPPV